MSAVELESGRCVICGDVHAGAVEAGSPAAELLRAVRDRQLARDEAARAATSLTGTLTRVAFGAVLVVAGLAFLFAGDD